MGEASLATHQQWGSFLGQYKAAEQKQAPSLKFRKPSVDWRRQEARGTLHVGTFYEGPPSPGAAAGTLSNYTPGNTFDRLDNVMAPFSDAEWAQKKQYRSWDMVK